MFVTKEDVLRLVDRLTEDELQIVHTFIEEIKEAHEYEMSRGQIEGLHDQDRYLEEGEKNLFDETPNRDLKRRERL
ncbi:hypothetical protein LGQ02_04310 [Bacillus shivajii]|uniref:hypothetical protein n=1 Tax=Bacillus shivajii TaxID=1983719 RepID=UPI001CF9A3D4|nr:hypothetical protein [Bacillus shivajii]UCZ54013.1 hypothetical protein LGQ02_04310 [Bacillus shivajii]